MFLILGHRKFCLVMIIHIASKQFGLASSKWNIIIDPVMEIILISWVKVFEGSSLLLLWLFNIYTNLKCYKTIARCLNLCLTNSNGVVPYLLNEYTLSYCSLIKYICTTKLARLTELMVCRFKSTLCLMRWSILRFLIMILTHLRFILSHLP